MRISDDHFEKIGGGPKRLDHTKLPLQHSLLPKAFIAVIMLAAGGGGLWFARTSGWIGTPTPVLAQAATIDETDAPDPFPLPQPKNPQVLVEPAEVYEQPAESVPITAPSPFKPVAVQRPEDIQRGIDALTKQIPPHETLIKRYQAQLADADRRQWPKPGGTMTYAEHLTDLYQRAKAKSDGSGAFRAEGLMGKYRDNRAKTESSLRFEQEIVTSLEKRIAAEKAKQ